MSKQCLELKNVCKTFYDFKLNNISFTLPKGYIMGLVGPNVPRYEQETGSLFRHLQLWRELYT